MIFFFAQDNWPSKLLPTAELYVSEFSKTPIFHFFTCQVVIGQFNKPITFKAVL